MTPGARVAAAIEILDQIKAGTPAEQALTSWARGSRFAGSKDRAAIRDHVFDALRARRSLGDGNGRALMLRLAQREEWDISALFSGEGHAPRSISPEEETALSEPPALSASALCDVPEWLWPTWQASLGDAAEETGRVQQERAPVFLRVNTRKGSADAVVSALSEDGVIVQHHPDVPGALEVLQNARRLKNTSAFRDGLFELQDASSQFAVQRVPVPSGGRILDYCAGGGGKALAFADLTNAKVFAHDISPARMRDIPERAARAGVRVSVLTSKELSREGPYDVVFCDAPCSGSGTWRRTPDAKWRLTEARLAKLQAMQADVLKAAAALVSDGGLLVYATCSVLGAENSDAVEAFQRVHPAWAIKDQFQRLPNLQGDGFFLSVLARQ